MISIILPVYNAKAYLHRCMDSIIAQTYRNWELLLVDDGSTDGSDKIGDEYAQRDGRIRVIHQPNGGVSAARNRGLLLAQGEYILFVDSDDYMLPEMCETMVRTLEREQADCVVCGTTETGGGYWRPAMNRNYTLEELKADMPALLPTELLAPPWNKIYKKEKIQQLFREDTSFGEDLIFVLNYLENCRKITFITDSPFYHEKGNESSLVVKIHPTRLLDIEKGLEAVRTFSKQPLYSKYFRDLTVYARQLLMTDTLGYAAKVTILNEWHQVAALKQIALHNYQGHWKNKLFLLCLKHRCWRLAYAMVNKRFLLGTQRRR